MQIWKSMDWTLRTRSWHRLRVEWWIACELAGFHTLRVFMFECILVIFMFFFFLASRRSIFYTGRKGSQTITITMSPARNSDCTARGTSLDLGMISTARATMIGCAKSVQVQMEFSDGPTTDKRKIFKNRIVLWVKCVIWLITLHLRISQNKCQFSFLLLWKRKAPGADTYI